MKRGTYRKIINDAGEFIGQVQRTKGGFFRIMYFAQINSGPHAGSSYPVSIGPIFSEVEAGQLVHARGAGYRHPLEVLQIERMKEDCLGNANWAIIPEGCLTPLQVWSTDGSDTVHLYGTQEEAETALATLFGQ